ncbi:MAG: hypothetical protein WBL40_02870 [Terrimicrobiaceae bacterium]
MQRNPLTKRYTYASQALNDRLLSRSDLKERWACSLETFKRRERDGLVRLACAALSAEELSEWLTYRHIICREGRTCCR